MREPLRTKAHPLKGRVFIVKRRTRPSGGRCSRKAHPPKGRALIEKSTPAQGAGVVREKHTCP